VSCYQVRIASRAGLLRLAAYMLAFTAGAAAMFAIYHLPVNSDVATRQITPATISAGNISAKKQSDPPASEPEQAKVAAVESNSLDARAIGIKSVAAEVPKELPPDVEAAVDVVAAVEATQAICVGGVTEPAPGRYAKLSLATTQAIAFVDVKPGDRVKKGWQVFSHWESPERLQAMKTELEKTKKIFAVAQTRAGAAKQTVERLRKLERSVPAQQLQDAETMATVRQGELETAELAVAEMESRFNALEFEFTQAFVTSPIDGVVASVDVITGERRQAGSGFRGVTILDTRVLNCRCMLNQDQIAMLERLATRSVTHTASAESPATENGQPGEAKSSFYHGLQCTLEIDGVERPAAILSVGLQADAKSGLIPILLEIQNADESLRSGITVNVCFRAK
jgi:hypothetical protein